MSKEERRASVSSRHRTPPPPNWGGGYSHILAIRVCAAREGMVFKPFGLVKGMVFQPFGMVKGLVIIENWSSIGSRLTGSLIIEHF